MSRRLTILWVFALASAAPASRASAADRSLTVFAAASLKETFEALAASFEKSHAGIKVRLDLAGSQELRTQSEHGARVDVFASADMRTMAPLEERGLVMKSALFARNAPVIVVPRNNPAAIHALTDLPKTKRLVIGAPEVPIGGYTIKVFDAAAAKYGGDLRAKLDAAVVSRELNVRQVLAKVALGEADAGIVYQTDAQAAKNKVDVIPIPPDINVQAQYPIAVVKASEQTALAREFVQLVLSPEGQKRLAGAGFMPISPAAEAPVAPRGPAPRAPQVPSR